MANTPYVLNQTDGLYYPITALPVGGGLTLLVGDEGVTSPPAYVPGEGEPLISSATYMTIMQVNALTSEEQWLYAALAVSDMVERYCWYSWRDEAVSVPVGLQLIVARMIASLLSRLSTTAQPGVKSESFGGYSYTLADGTSSSNVIEMFKNDLKLYRRPFIGC